MGRGGSREGAGRKTGWASGRRVEETKLIRVPIEFADQLLEMAHELDAGEVIDLDTKSKSKTKLGSYQLELDFEMQSRLDELKKENAVLRKKLHGVIPVKLEDLRSRALSSLGMGEQALAYKRLAKSLSISINTLLNSVAEED